MRVLWTAKRTNQSILKEINPEHPLEGLMLKNPACSNEDPGQQSIIFFKVRKMLTVA